MKKRLKIALGAILPLILSGCDGNGVVREKLEDGWLFMRADGSAGETNTAASTSLSTRRSLMEMRISSLRESVGTAVRSSSTRRRRRCWKTAAGCFSSRTA